MDTDLEFIETSADEIQSMLIDYIENEIGETLYDGDERSIYANALAYVLSVGFNAINDACRQKMLRYATDDVLDALGETRGVTRIYAQPATTKLKFSIASPLQSNVIIPKGIRVTGDYEHYFATDEAATITAGETSVTVSATAENGGVEYNGISPSTINTIVDVSEIPLVSSVANTTTTDGGTDDEDDETYRERIREAENSYSNAGTAKTYRFWALSADPTITDAIVESEDETITQTLVVRDGHACAGGTYIQAETLSVYLSDGSKAELNHDYSFTYENCLLDIKLLEPIKSYETLKISYMQMMGGHVRIIPLTQSGVPSDAVIKKVKDVCSSDDVKPLTDVVDVVKPETVTYDIDLTYYTTAANASSVIDMVEGSDGAIEQYKKWQSSEMGLDINPDYLRKLILAPSTGEGANRVVITSPEYTELTDKQVAQFSGKINVSHVIKSKF